VPVVTDDVTPQPSLVLEPRLSGIVLAQPRYHRAHDLVEHARAGRCLGIDRPDRAVHLSDVQVHRSSSHAAPTPATSSRPSCPISSSSMATRPCAASKAGPVHFTGRPRVKRQVFAG